MTVHGLIILMIYIVSVYFSSRITKNKINVLVVV